MIGVENSAQTYLRKPFHQDFVEICTDKKCVVWTHLYSSSIFAIYPMHYILVGGRLESIRRFFTTFRDFVAYYFLVTYVCLFLVVYT